MGDLSKCRSCGASVMWLVSASTGKRAPIDALPNPAGNVIITPRGTYVIAVRGPSAPLPRTPLYTNHFQTCPKAADWRPSKKGTGSAAS